MSPIDRLLSHFTTPVQIRVAHRYRDVVTGEQFDVVSVGTKTQIERYDADRRPENAVKTSKLRRAIDNDLVVHDPGRCPECL